MTAPGEQDHQPALESGAQGKVLLGVQTNLTLKTWAGFFCLVGSFSSDVCTNSKYSDKTSKHDLEIASAFASNQPHLIIAVLLNSVELKSETCRFQKQELKAPRR